jgi:hypothetical protein
VKPVRRQLTIDDARSPRFVRAAKVLRAYVRLGELFDDSQAACADVFAQLCKMTEEDLDAELRRVDELVAQREASKPRIDP